MGPNRRLRRLTGETNPTVERANATITRETILGGIYRVTVRRVRGEASERSVGWGNRGEEKWVDYQPRREDVGGGVKGEARGKRAFIRVNSGTNRSD